MTIALVHANPIAIQGAAVRVDRKFHIGMLRYARDLHEPVVSVNPQLPAEQPIMDPIELRLNALPYELMTIRTGPDLLPAPSELPRLHALLARSTLVYGGDLGIARLCRRQQVPYVLMLEYDLPTRIAATTLQVSGRARRIARAARCVWRHLMQSLPEIRAAHSVHCNGFPVYETARRHHPNCLLYFDSRMSAEMLIAPEQLEARLSNHRGRPLRLLYSGRYEPFKGALDVLRIGIGCLESGLDIELHCYGQGSLREPMLRMAALHPGRLHVHDAIAYPDLVERSRSFDLFVCCHVQNDPSCTYLEALGCGLPVVGYANAMWRRMCQVSGAGLCSRMGDPLAVAASIETLVHNRAMLADMSRRALAFARGHLFEAEFDKRIAALNSLACARDRPARRAQPDGQAQQLAGQEPR